MLLENWNMRECSLWHLEQIQKEVDFNLRREQVVKVQGSEHLVETEKGSEKYDRIPDRYRRKSLCASCKRTGA